VQDSEDQRLLVEVALDIGNRASAKLSHFEHAALMNFVEQLHTLDLTSRDLLQTLKVLADPAPASGLPLHKLPEDPYQPSTWNPERLLKALFPALCWIAAYVFWITIDPPGGPAVTMIAAAFGLMALMTPANLFGLLVVLLLSMFVTVAPVYMFIMPVLDSGFGILSLVFVYAFVFAYLGGISPVLKLGPLAMFVMMIDINNDQVYSFILLVTAGLVMLLGVSIVVLVHSLLSPMRPEKIMLRSVRRFLSGCARIVGELHVLPPQRQTRERKLKKRIFETMILPVSAQLPSVEKNLDYTLFPANNPEKVQQLVDNLQSIRFRLQSLDAVYNKAVRESPELMQSLAQVNDKWRKRVQRVFRKWARLEKTGTLIMEWTGEANLSQEVEQQLVKLKQEKSTNDIDDRALKNLYAVMGSTQSLLDAIEKLDDSMQRINWDQWAVARF